MAKTLEEFAINEIETLREENKELTTQIINTNEKNFKLNEELLMTKEALSRSEEKLTSLKKLLRIKLINLGSLKKVEVLNTDVWDDEELYGQLIEIFDLKEEKENTNE